jgi:hypothetical protein
MSVTRHHKDKINRHRYMIIRIRNLLQHSKNVSDYHAYIDAGNEYYTN